MVSHETIRPGGVLLGLQPSGIWADRAAAWPVYVDEQLTPELDPTPEDAGGRQEQPRVLAGGREGMVTSYDPTPQLHLRCGTCDQSVLCLSPGTGEPYRVTAADMLSGILAHLRRSHEDAVRS